MEVGGMRRIIGTNRILPIAIIAIYSLFFPSCSSTPVPDPSPALESVDLPEMGARIFYPEKWTLLKDEFFQVKAVGLAPNGLPATVEYRGLIKGKEQDQNPDLYAEGWYEAIRSSYPEWKYIHRTKESTDDFLIYLFEGTYRVASDTYRKTGRLIFYKNRIHTLYYTTLDIHFDQAASMFDYLNSRQIFNEEIETNEP